MVYNNKRKELVQQTFRTLDKTVDIGKAKGFIGEDKEGDFKAKSLNYLKVKNDLIKCIDVDWEFMVVCDDDLYFSKGWLELMEKAMHNNPNVWVLAATTWPTHKHLEVRKDITISDMAPGGCCMIRREAWDLCGPYPIDKRKTYIFVDRVHELGGKVAFLNDQTKVVHCGIKSLIDKKGRSPKSIENLQALADYVGAKTL